MMLSVLLRDDASTLSAQTDLTRREAFSGILGIVSLTTWFFLLVSFETLLFQRGIAMSLISKASYHKCSSITSSVMLTQSH